MEVKNGYSQVADVEMEKLLNPIGEEKLQDILLMGKDAEEDMQDQERVVDGKGRGMF